MPSEKEVVSHFHNTILVRVSLQDFIEILSFPLSTLNLNSLVCTDFQCNKLAAFFHIFAKQHLPESTGI